MVTAALGVLTAGRGWAPSLHCAPVLTLSAWATAIWGGGRFPCVCGSAEEECPCDWCQGGRNGRMFWGGGEAGCSAQGAERGVGALGATIGKGKLVVKCQGFLGVWGCQGLTACGGGRAVVHWQGSEQRTRGEGGVSCVGRSSGTFWVDSYRCVQ
jgi:hypothetical protein